MLFPLHRLRIYGIDAETKGQCALISADQLEIYTQSRDAEFDDHDSYEFDFDNMAYTDHLSVEEHLITTPLSKPNELPIKSHHHDSDTKWTRERKMLHNVSITITTQTGSPKESIILGVNRRLRRLFLLFIPVA